MKEIKTEEQLRKALSEVFYDRQDAEGNFDVSEATSDVVSIIEGWTNSHIEEVLKRIETPVRIGGVPLSVKDKVAHERLRLGIHRE